MYAYETHSLEIVMSFIRVKEHNIFQLILCSYSTLNEYLKFNFISDAMKIVDNWTQDTQHILSFEDFSSADGVSCSPESAIMWESNGM